MYPFFFFFFFFLLNSNWLLLIFFCSRINKDQISSNYYFKYIIKNKDAIFESTEMKYSGKKSNNIESQCFVYSV